MGDWLQEQLERERLEEISKKKVEEENSWKKDYKGGGEIGSVYRGGEREGI